MFALCNCVTCVVLSTCSSLCVAHSHLVLHKCTFSDVQPLSVFFPGSTSLARDMHWSSAGSRLFCLKAREPSWRLRDSFWKRNWTSWAPKILLLPSNWTQTPFHFHQPQAMYVLSVRRFSFLGILPNQICSVRKPQKTTHEMSVVIQIQVQSLKLENK